MSKIRRYFFCALFLAASLGLALGALALLPPGSAVTKENYDRIQNGMTISEVESILGKPLGVFTSGPWDNREPPCYDVAGWIRDDGAAISVALHREDHRVINSAWFESTETVIDKLRRWLYLSK